MIILMQFAILDAGGGGGVDLGVGAVAEDVLVALSYIISSTLPSLAMLRPRTKTSGAMAEKGLREERTSMEEMTAMTRK